MTWMHYVLISVLVIAAIVVVSCSGSSKSAAETIEPQEYLGQFAETGTPHLLIDVRTAAEFESGAIPGAINLPVETITKNLDQIPDDLPVVLYCQSGNRSGQAAKKLAKEGYEDLYDLGGISAWEAAGLPVE